jgi:DNA-binding CsgD family transcriptional regulator
VSGRQANAEIFGREPELRAVRAFLDQGSSARGLLLFGPPGVGKTTLWEAGVSAARERGVRVLCTQASEAEAQLAFTALIDLLDGVGTEGLDVPAPQLQALEVALLRAPPAGAPPDAKAIAFGFLNTLRALEAGGPLMLAVDDLQWLDAPSADALAFAARRLDHADVRLLLTKREGPPTPLEDALAPRNLACLEVGALSLGATRRLLSERLELSLPRHVLRRLHESTLGNPLFALEVGRRLAARESLEPAEDFPVPERVEDLLGTQVEALPPDVRRLLLAVALNAALQAPQLVKVAGSTALDDAVDRGLLRVDAGRLRPSHPLLAAAAKARSGARERRRLHLELASVVADEEVRARHLALAAEGTDEELAATLAAAARSAGARGAVRDRVELAEHALRLTPSDAPERSERLLSLADSLSVSGTREDERRLTGLLQPQLDSLPSGTARVRAYLLLTDGLIESNDDIQRHLDQALAESRDDAALRARVLAEISENMALIRVERIREAESLAREAASVVGLQGRPLHSLSWALALQGRDVFHLCEEDPAPGLRTLTSPKRTLSRQLTWRGELGRARQVLTQLLSLADDRGEAYSYALLRLHLCQLELRIGDCVAAGPLLDEWGESSDPLMWPMYERSHALLAAARGLPAEAVSWGEKTIALAERTGARWDWLEAHRAVGLAELLRREPARAAESLRAVWVHTEREGVDEPGVFPVAPDLVEALVNMGELEEARATTERLRELSGAQEHPWGLVSARRCDASIRLASTYDDPAADCLAEAAASYGRLGLRFDHARTLLSLGRVQRQSRKWAAARASLESAAGTFDELGSPGWAEAARSELARVGARRPRAAGELTEAEQRVAQLAADGLSNKEIAGRLFVTVRTVEVHLKHAYAKLGIRSRTQLAGRLSQRA